jgi:hypothetical protein
MERMSPSDRDLLGAMFGILVVLPICLSVFAGALVLAGQTFTWLRFAYWPELTLQHAFLWFLRRPLISETGWLGIDRILQWWVDTLPLALQLIIILPIIWLVVGLSIGKLIAKFGEAIDVADRRRDAARAASETNSLRGSDTNR